ncbi:unnamed protein product [Alopecurus aequalis]
MASCPALQPRGSSTPSFLRAPPPASMDRVCFDPSRVLMQADAARDCKRRRRHGGDDDSRASKKQAVGRVASPIEHLSCARIRPFVRTSRPREETHVTARGGAQDVISKQNTGESIYFKKIEAVVPAPSRPKKQTSSSSQVSARAIAHGVITKPKASESITGTGIRPTVAVQPPGCKVKDKLKFPRGGVLQYDADGVIKTKHEAGERAQATVTKSIRQIQPPAPGVNHQDPYAPTDALRTALATARQALNRRHNVYARQREEARRELAKVAQTVFFNDPYISLDDVLKP